MATVPDMMRQYGYLDEGSYQPDVASLALRAAKEYLANSGVPEPEQDSALYDIACYMLAMHWYDNRSVTPVGTTPTGEIAKGLNSIIEQIKNYD